MQVDINGNLVDVIIEYKNNKNLYIRVKDDLKIYVTCNKFVSKSEIIRVIENNKKSIFRMYQHQEKSKENNLFYYFLGDKYTVIFDETIKDYFIEDNMIYVKNKTMLDKFYKKSCEEIFSKRINACALMFDNIPNFRLRIRKMTTRWGVNNIKDHIITLNSELIKKDVSLIDYVCIHELCHFIHANHSASFWMEVEKRYPYYKIARKRLREE